MAQIIEVALGLPTVIYTFLLACVGVYWVLVLAGGVASDALEPSHDGATGAADAGDAADADGADHTASGHGHGGESTFGATVLSIFGIGQGPLSLAMSSGILFTWMFSMIGGIYAAPALQAIAPAGLVAGALGVGSLVLGFIAGGLSMRPLAPLFRIHTTRAQETLVDSVCRITSSRVDGEFGEAIFERPGAPLILNVRCPRPNSLTKGVTAVIVAYDSQRDTYEVGELEPPAR